MQINQWFFWLGCCVLPGLLGAQSLEEGMKVTSTYALTNVHIITRPGQMIDMGTIVLRDGLIEAVGANVNIPVDAEVLEADSMYVYAGFIDGFSQIGIPKPDEEDRDDREEIKDPGNPPMDRAGIQPQRSAASLFDPSEKNIGEWRELGFTTAHVAPRGNFMPGKGAIVLLGEGEASALVLRADAAMVSNLDGAGRVYPATILAVMSKWRELYRQADQVQQHRERYQSKPAGMPRPEYTEAHQALLPVIKREMPVFFLTPDLKSAFRVLQLQEELGFNLVLAGLRQGWVLQEELAQKGWPVLLSLDLPDPPKREEQDKEADEEEEKKDEPKEPLDPEKEKLEARRAAEMEKYEKLAADFQEAGIPFGFATLEASSKEVRKNFARIIEAGLSADDLLAALTTRPAELLGLSAVMGTVEKGKIANLVVSDKPYFEEKAKVRFVLVDGQVFRYSGEKAEKVKAEDLKKVVGEWNYTLTVPGQTRSGTITLTEEGGYLEGVISSESAEGVRDLENLVFDGRSLAFEQTLEFGGQSLRLSWNVDVDEDTFEGSVTVGEYGSFDVEGERVPK